MFKLPPKERRRLGMGLAFLAPNILGFLAFTLFPLVFSVVMAFSNWDLRYHNMFKELPLTFGLGNFLSLLQNPDFWRFLGNTLFLMIGIPFSVAGSLFLAVLLTKDMGLESQRSKLLMAAGGLLVTSAGILAMNGMGATAMMMVFFGLAGMMFVGGSLGGSTVYRTMFYLPHFTAGVATFILWKKIYSSHTGPLNSFLAPILDAFGGTVNLFPPVVVQSGFSLSLLAVAGIFYWGVEKLRRLWRDGDVGWASMMIPGVFMLVPLAAFLSWSTPGWSNGLLVLLFVAGAALVLKRSLSGQDIPCDRNKGLGTALILALALMTLQLTLLGLGIVFHRLPSWADAGLAPPSWLTDYHWAKPAMMIMAFWGMVGSNSMLLYLAGLSNIPQELYEAADIDGAGRFQRFWNITWPQLAPVTFFIMVMGVIQGLQGGFEMAYAMTQGGPAGATTTLSFFIYSEGFETGRLGYASGVAWTLFAMVFVVTMFNWKFGNRYVND